MLDLERRMVTLLSFIIETQKLYTPSYCLISELTLWGFLDYFMRRLGPHTNVLLLIVLLQFKVYENWVVSFIVRIRYPLLFD